MNEIMGNNGGDYEKYGLKEKYMKQTLKEQMDLKIKEKKEERRKRIEEEKEFLRKSDELYMFGRGKGGGGEPIRNEEGRIMVGRKKTLITEYLEPKIRNYGPEISNKPISTNQSITIPTFNNNNVNKSIEPQLSYSIQPTISYEKPKQQTPMTMHNNNSYICHNCGFSPNGNHLCMNCLRKRTPQYPQYPPQQIKVITPKPIRIPLSFQIPQPQPIEMAMSIPHQPQIPQTTIIEKTNDDAIKLLELKNQQQLKDIQTNLEMSINDIRSKMETYQHDILNEINFLTNQNKEANAHRNNTLYEIQRIKDDLVQKSANDQKQMKYLHDIINAGKEIIRNQKNNKEKDYMQKPVITNNSRFIENDLCRSENDDKHQIVLNEMNSYESINHDRNYIRNTIDYGDSCAFGRNCSKSCKNLVDIYKKNEDDIKQKYERAKKKLYILNELENNHNEINNFNNSTNNSNYKLLYKSKSYRHNPYNTDIHLY